MTRTITSILSILPVLSLVACENMSSEDSTLTEELESSQSSQFEDTKENNAQDEQEVGVIETELQEPQSKADLICSTGGFYELDGQTQARRMELFQYDDMIVIHTEKGAMHPGYEDVFHSAIF